MKMTGLAKLFKRRSFRPAAISASAFQRCAGGWTSQPALGVSYWLLAWLLVVCLQMLGIEPPVSQWMVGQRAPLSVVAAVDFLPPSAAGAAAEGEALAPLIAAGTHLVERGEILSADQLALLRVYEAQSSTLKALIQDGGNLAGQALLLALGVLISAALLRWLRREPRDHNKQILLFVVIGGLALVLTHWCLVLDRLGLLWPPAIVAGFLPLTLAPLLAAILIGPWHAIIMGFWVSFTAATFAGQDFAIFIIGLAMAVMIARLGRFVRTRTKVLRIGLAAGALGALFVLSFALAAQQPWSNMIPQVLAVLVGGLLSALAVLMILPLLEIIFGVTTDISLLELADMEHPLLKRLAIEAAGTYHHSLMVANLAQAAVATIGGNSLRVTIAAYFHDIGKLVKPEFFSENIPLGANPHDELLPSMSALVIASHVKEGVNLAQEYRLPRPVLEAIQEHHGTSLISFFYLKADRLQKEAASSLTQAERGSLAPVQEEDFRYPGPKPRSRETGVLSLADAIEAASRSLEKVSSGHIETLVREIIDTKLKDGQLEDCDLTLQEIGCLARSFIFTLTNMLHGRIKYPQGEDSHQQSAAMRPD